MTRQVKRSAASALALDSAAVATPARISAGASGEAGSKDALAKLDQAVRELRALAIQPILQSAINALNAGDHQAGAEWAIKALEQDERNGFGWYLLAFAREKAGDFVSSIKCYESALSLLPDHAEVANDLGRLAYRMGMKEQSEKLFRHFLARHPGHFEASNNLACVLRDEGRFEEAIDLLKDVIGAESQSAMLWNTLGAVVTEQGDLENALIFFEEATRLDPAFAKARYNLGNSRLALGQLDLALADCEAAMAHVMPDEERQMMRLARSTILMAQGRIGEGWDEYEARLHHQFSDVTLFLVDRPAWKPGNDLAGKSLLVMGEQGLGDEILFANTLPDVVEALGEDGRLSIAVEPRLAQLFQRSFPSAQVGAHVTAKAEGRTVRAAPFVEDQGAIDLWAPMGSLLREYRRTAEAFPTREQGFLEPDPERVAHWRGVLEEAPPGRKVGLLWKSLVKSGVRNRYFSAFEHWSSVLTTPGVSFINLQYGDCAEEIEQARRDFGVEIWTPPGIDLKQDLDDVAALACALDLVVGFSNATLNLAGACGAPVWLITWPGSWPRLGQPRYLWYPQSRLFTVPVVGAWETVMPDVAEALAEFAGAAER